MDDNLVNQQILLLEKVLNIARIQVVQLKQRRKLIVRTNAIEALREKTPLLAVQCYLDLFVETVNFLIEKIKNKEQNYKFYLGNVRTLLDIYSYVLYLCNQGKDKQVIIYAIELLYTLARSYEKEKSISDSYKKGYLLYKPFLDGEDINIPINIQEFNSSFRNKLKIKYPDLKQRLKPEYIIKSCPKTIEIFPWVVKKLYGIQIYFSNYVHGNFLTKGYHGNERIWIICESQIISALIAELVDTEILNSINGQALSNWRKDFFAERKTFVQSWQKERQIKNGK